MAKQEITLQGLDGQLDKLILTTNDETANGKLEDCARMLFPQEAKYQMKRTLIIFLVLKMSCLFLMRMALSIRLSILVEAMLESLLVDIKYYVLGRLYIRNPLFVLNHMEL